MKDLIERFTKEGPAAAPFELRSGSVVIDPEKFHAAILLEVAGGPAGPRAILGSLEGDLRDFFTRKKAQKGSE